jgi:hypothetical protein
MALYKGIEKERIKCRPEDIATVRDDPEKLKEIIGNPYGNYDPEPLKFKASR